MTEQLRQASAELKRCSAELQSRDHEQQAIRAQLDMQAQESERQAWALIRLQLKVKGRDLADPEHLAIGPAAATGHAGGSGKAWYMASLPRLRWGGLQLAEALKKYEYKYTGPFEITFFSFIPA